MTEFEQVLDECLRELEQGISSVDDCLKRNPAHAPQLRPILLTAEYLQNGREARPSAAFKARVRTRLKRGMQARPRRSSPFGFFLLRPAMAMAALALTVLATGTAFAQGALPGEVFYPWKRLSENAWRSVSPDPVGTELALAQRRADELLAVADDPALYPQALAAYLDVTSRLEDMLSPGNAGRIRQVLDAHAEQFDDLGVPVPELDVLTPFHTRTPTSTPLRNIDTPRPDPTLPAVTVPPVLPTDVPRSTDVPGLPPSSEILPTILPTIGIPPPIP